MGNFTTLNGGRTFTVSSGQIFPTFSGSVLDTTDASVVWAGAGTFTNDQYATIDISWGTTSTSDQIGVIVRCNSTTGTNRAFYSAYVRGTTGIGTNYYAAIAYKAAGASPVELTSTSTLDLGATPVSRTLTLEAEGTALRLFIGATQILSTTDANLTTGKPGIIGGASETVRRGDNFVGGNLTAGTVIPQLAAFNRMLANA